METKEQKSYRLLRELLENFYRSSSANDTLQWSLCEDVVIDSKELTEFAKEQGWI